MSRINCDSGLPDRNRWRTSRSCVIPDDRYADVPDNLSQTLLKSWDIPFVPTALILITAVVYLNGWRFVRVTRPSELPSWRPMCFVGGLLFVWLALASPIDALANYLLLAHMTQHLLFISVAPPLIVLGCPAVPMLRGLPRSLVSKDGLGRWFGCKPIQWLRKVITHPLFGWLSMNLAILTWHIPAAYELALRSENWHNVEHCCFLFTSLTFWWFVLQPWPNRSSWSRWTVLPYIFSSNLVNIGLSAFLTFCGTVVYPTYASVPRLFRISALDDQAAAGCEMWALGSVPFIVALVPLLVQLFSSQQNNRAPQVSRTQ